MSDRQRSYRCIFCCCKVAKPCCDECVLLGCKEALGNLLDLSMDFLWFLMSLSSLAFIFYRIMIAYTINDQ